MEPRERSAKIEIAVPAIEKSVGTDPQVTEDRRRVTSNLSCRIDWSSDNHFIDINSGWELEFIFGEDNEVTGAIVAMGNTELKGERIDGRDVVPIPLMPDEAARDKTELQGR